LTGRWVPHDTRDEVVDFVAALAEKTELAQALLVGWLGIARGKFASWRSRYGRANEHNGSVPRDHWITDDERTRILEFHASFPLEGYRRLTYMMLDRNVVAVSPATTWRVLRKAGVIDRFKVSPSQKGKGFTQPVRPHQHWHIDIAYINVAGTFYYLCAILDGASRAILHHEIRESMREADVEIVLQRAREKHPDARPRLISDNGPQFIARDFKEFIRVCGMDPVRISPYYPQSNGKMERWNKTMKVEAIRVSPPTDFADACRKVATFVEHYNSVRLHSAIGFITPNDFLAGRGPTIWAERDRKLEVARARRAERRAALRVPSQSSTLNATFPGALSLT
jgi:transposase InsO family protein